MAMPCKHDTLGKLPRKSPSLSPRGNCHREAQYFRTQSLMHTCILIQMWFVFCMQSNNPHKMFFLYSQKPNFLSLGCTCVELIPLWIHCTMCGCLKNPFLIKSCMQSEFWANVNYSQLLSLRRLLPGNNREHILALRGWGSHGFSKVIVHTGLL